MKTLTRHLLAAIVLVLVSLPASAQTAREQLERFAEGLDTLRAGFEQVVVSSDGVVQDQSTGRVWLSRPDHFRWEYGGDFPELVVADGTSIWVYDEALEQVTVKSQAETAVSSPLAVLTDPDRLDEQYEVRDVGATDEAALLELRAKTMDNQFERLLVGMADDSIVLIIMEDAFGLRTELRFTNVERNPRLDTSLFEFTPPEGSDVIGALPGSAQSR